MVGGLTMRWILMTIGLAACSTEADGPPAVADGVSPDLGGEVGPRPDVALDTSGPEALDSSADTEVAPEDTSGGRDADDAAPPDSRDTSDADLGDLAPGDLVDAPDGDAGGGDIRDAGPDDVLGGLADLLDYIFGVDVPRTESWWVHDGTIHRGREAVRLRGVNWFGLETADRALHGTWFGRSVESFLAELKSLGFDSLRIPVSPQVIHPGFAAAAWARDAYESGAAPTGLEQLQRLLAATGDAGLSVLLDFHTCHPDSVGQNLPGRPDGCPDYTLETWRADLAALAALAENHPHVLGIDLCNEPYKLTWAEWKVMAEGGAEAVLTTNPRLLVFVEGVAEKSAFGGYYPFWGGNLTEAALDPPNIPASRLVFSPHTYGPGISAQTYFAAASFPANMPAIWDIHFGHLTPRYALAVGEFGGFYDDAHPGEVAWNEAFVTYLATLDRGQPASFFYWAMNPNSGDTGGLYELDWVTLVPRKLTLLAPLLAP